MRVEALLSDVAIYWCNTVVVITTTTLKFGLRFWAGLNAVWSIAEICNADNLGLSWK